MPALVGPTTSIYVVLDALDTLLGRFHWSLAIFASNIQPDWAHVDLFQIIDVADTPSTTNQSFNPTSTNVQSASHSLSLPNSVSVGKTWQLKHHAGADLFAPGRTCVGAVRLPDAVLPYNDLRVFIEEQEAEQGDSETIRGVPWSCAQWVMRVLARLTESGLYEELDMNHFYPKMQRLGIKLSGLHMTGPHEMHVVDFA